MRYYIDNLVYFPYKKNPVFRKKINYLLKFIKQFDDLPGQGTQRWLDQRKKTIGGSEIGTLIGDNPYQDIKDLIKTKLGWSEFRGNIHTYWGKVFEPNVQRFLEILFRCKIYETGSLPGCIEGTSYSPDGFAVTLSENIERLIRMGYIEEHDYPKDALTILFEIKSPSRRKPIKGKIPHHYISQPLSGLCHFPFIDLAYFVDVTFRIAPIDYMSEAFFNEYNNKYHKDRYPYDYPLAMGVMGIFEKDPDHRELNLGRLVDDLVDFGDTDARLFEKMIYLASVNKLHIEYFDPIPRYEVNNAVYEQSIEYKISQSINCMDYIADKNDYLPIGYLPYKIYNFNIVPLQRQENFMKEIEPLIKQFLNTLEIIKAAPNPKDKFDEIFGCAKKAKPVVDSSSYIPPTSEFADEFDSDDDF